MQTLEEYVEEIMAGKEESDEGNDWVGFFEDWYLEDLEAGMFEVEVLEMELAC